MIAIKATKPGNAAGPSKVRAKISAREKVEISVTMELCRHVLDGKGMLDQVYWCPFLGEKETHEITMHKGKQCC